LDLMIYRLPIEFRRRCTSRISPAVRSGCLNKDGIRFTTMPNVASKNRKNEFHCYSPFNFVI
jgi:hypothetical protein